MWRAFPQRGGRAVDEHSEIYVGLDVEIARHAVAVADGERSGFRVATLVVVCHSSQKVGLGA